MNLWILLIFPLLFTATNNFGNKRHTEIKEFTNFFGHPVTSLSNFMPSLPIIGAKLKLNNNTKNKEEIFERKK